MTGINITIEGDDAARHAFGVFGAYLYAASSCRPVDFHRPRLFCLSAATCEGSCIDLTIFRSVVIL